MIVPDDAAYYIEELEAKVVDLTRQNLECSRLASEASVKQHDAELKAQELQARCPKCNFTLLKSIMFVRSGNVGADLGRQLEPCPNDSYNMERVTWEHHARELGRMSEQLLARAVAGEGSLKDHIEVLRRMVEEYVWCEKHATNDEAICVWNAASEGVKEIIVALESGQTAKQLLDTRFEKRWQ